MILVTVDSNQKIHQRQVRVRVRSVVQEHTLLMELPVLIALGIVFQLQVAPVPVTTVKQVRDPMTADQRAIFVPLVHTPMEIMVVFDVLLGKLPPHQGHQNVLIVHAEVKQIPEGLLVNNAVQDRFQKLVHPANCAPNLRYPLQELVNATRAAQDQEEVQAPVNVSRALLVHTPVIMASASCVPKEHTLNLMGRSSVTFVRVGMRQLILWMKGKLHVRYVHLVHTLQTERFAFHAL